MTRRDIEARLNSVNDALGPRVSVLDTGPERGCRIVTLRDGDGLEATVNLDRGIDVRDVWWRGIPVAFTSPSGEHAPAFYDREGMEWLRTWPGGLVSTCGFRNIGVPVETPEESHGIHGRAGQLAARDVAVRGAWEDGRFVSTVEGTTREARMFGENISSRRTLTVVSGSHEIRITDEIRNDGFQPEHLLLLYHVNVGWPLLEEGARVVVEGTAEPRDEDAARGVKEWSTIRGPDPDFAEQVFFHDVPAGKDGWTRAALVNESRDLRFELAWKDSQLPSFTQWQSLTSGAYALGFEPGNGLPLGRVNEIEAGRGDLLQPGETKTVELVCSLGGA